MGVAVYDRKGHVMAITSELGQVMTATPPEVIPAMAEGHGGESFVRVSEKSPCRFLRCRCIARMKLWVGWR